MRQGVDVHRVQRLLRHSDVRVTTKIYAHLVVEDLRAALDAHTPLLPASIAPREAAPERDIANSAPIEPHDRENGDPECTSDARNHSDAEKKEWCALLGSNQRPPPCQSSPSSRQTNVNSGNQSQSLDVCDRISPNVWPTLAADHRGEAPIEPQKSRAARTELSILTTRAPHTLPDLRRLLTVRQ